MTSSSKGFSTSSSVYGASDFKPEDVTQPLAEATRMLYEGDRRLDTRLEVRGVGVEIRPINGERAEWQSCTPINFSRGGILLESPEPLEAERLLWLHIRTRKAETNIDSFRVAAEVRHSTQQGDVYRAGLKFRLDLIMDMRRVHAEHSLSRLEGFLHAIGAIDVNTVVHHTDD